MLINLWVHVAIAGFAEEFSAIPWWEGVHPVQVRHQSLLGDHMKDLSGVLLVESRQIEWLLASDAFSEFVDQMKIKVYISGEFINLLFNVCLLVTNYSLLF